MLTYLDSLAARAVDQPPDLRPRPISRFEPSRTGRLPFEHPGEELSDGGAEATELDAESTTFPERKDHGPVSDAVDSGMGLRDHADRGWDLRFQELTAWLARLTMTRAEGVTSPAQEGILNRPSSSDAPGRTPPMSAGEVVGFHREVPASPVTTRPAALAQAAESSPLLPVVNRLETATASSRVDPDRSTSMPMPAGKTVDPKSPDREAPAPRPVLRPARVDGRLAGGRDEHTALRVGILQPAREPIPEVGEPSAPAAAPGARSIHVSIGRVEIRASREARQTPANVPAARADASILTLDTYLQRRSGRGRP